MYWFNERRNKEFKYLLFLQQKTWTREELLQSYCENTKHFEIMEIKKFKYWRQNRCFKSLAISKLTHLALVTKISTSTINLLTKTQMEFIWKGKTQNIKSSTLCNDYDNGGLKNVVFSKIVSLQCSWIKRLFDNNFHEWKVIPLYLIRWYLGGNFKFYSNLEVSHSILGEFPRFYKEVIIRWGKHLSSLATLPSTVACQFIWHNKHIQIDNKSI